MNFRTWNYVMDAADAALTDCEKDGIKYIGKNTFRKAVSDGLEYSITGQTKLKESGGNTNMLSANGKQYAVENCSHHMVRGYIPVGEKKYIEYVGISIPVMFLFLCAALAAVIAAVVFILLTKNRTTKVLAPDWENVETEKAASVSEAEKVNDFDLVIIDMPNGNVHYDSVIEENGTTYTGSTHIKIEKTDGTETHLIADQDVEVADGTTEDFSLDFTMLDTELTAGYYDGTAEFIYPDGGSEQKTIEILIRQNNTGSVEFGYSDKVIVDKDSGKISFHYESDVDDTHETLVQLILLKDDEEYLLGQSGKISRGQTVTEMDLNQDMADRLAAGGYNGYLRIYFNMSDDEELTTDAIHTDIDVKITVESQAEENP